MNSFHRNNIRKMTTIINQEYSEEPKGELLIRSEEGMRVFCIEDVEFTTFWLHTIKIDYPEIYDSLALFFKSYAINAPKFQFLVVRQFLLCRFGALDAIPDIDEVGNTTREYIMCPIRAVCPMKRIPCEARITTKLGKGEEAVMKMIYEGKTESEIASARGTSIATVATQRQNAYTKLGVNSKAEFVILATQKQMFPKN